MKSSLIVLLLSILLAQESETNCAEWKQLESKCATYCFKVLRPVFDHSRALQSQVNDLKCEKQSLDKLEDAEELIQRHLNVHDGKIDQKIKDLLETIDIAILKQTESNTKQIRDFMEKFQNIESQLEKIVAFNTKLTQNYEKQSNLNEANLQKENSDFLAKFQNIEQQLKRQFEVQAEKLDQKLENQSNVTKSLVQTQVDNLKATINHMELSENMKIIQEQFKSYQKDLDNQIPNTLAQFENIKKHIQGNIKVYNMNIESQLYNLRKTNEIKKLTRKKSFKKIGSKHYYIERTKKFNWYAAAHKCLQFGGHLASIQNSLEFEGLIANLKGDNYWIDLNDLGTNGKYISAATGLAPNYLNWHDGEPSNLNNAGHCGELFYDYGKHKMNDDRCDITKLIICELENIVSNGK